MSEAVNATESTFDEEVLKADKPVIVDFWASWCGPCRMVAPVLDQIADENPGVKLVKVDVDANPGLAAKYQITGIPAMKVFSEGKVVKEVVGAQPKPALEKEFADYLTK